LPWPEASRIRAAGPSADPSGCPSKRQYATCRAHGRRREAGEPLLEVDGHREPVDVAREARLLVRELVARAETAAQDEGREGLDVDRVPLEVHVVQPDHRGAAVVAVLVVHEVHVHIVAGAVAHRRAAGLPVVPVEGEEDLVVLGDEGVPEALAVAVEEGGSVRA
jgi:hypothetical protein